MGQTLTHGVYLPDEGERNCYSGLAANWQLLDGAVGTVAEHTTALAGKAPAVHTHTKADITDFPAYGTTSGTICEGNDSRLSDARTPVAHTHLTADVTDLLNSAHTWSGDNTYSKTVAIERSTDTGNFLALKNTVAELGSTPASATPVTIAYPDKNNDNLGYMGMFYDTDGSNRFRLYVRNKFTSGSPSTSGTTDYTTFQLRLNADQSKEGILRATFRPYDSNTYDLGSSSYQWNNLYAKNYYYNGVAWGLDKANVWTGVNTFSGATNCVITFKFGTAGSYNDIRWLDNNNSGYATLRCKTNTISLGLRYSSASAWYDGSSININDSGSVNIKSYDGTDAQLTYFTNNAVYPSVSSVTDLGTTNKKWKTINGVNPGALSLPDMSSGTGVSLSAGSNSYSPPSSGWLSINLTGAISVVCGNFCHSGTDMLSVPVVKGSTYTVTVATSGTAYLFVSQGNV